MVLAFELQSMRPCLQYSAPTPMPSDEDDDKGFQWYLKPLRDDAMASMDEQRLCGDFN